MANKLKTLYRSEAQIRKALSARDNLELNSSAKLNEDALLEVDDALYDLVSCMKFADPVADTQEIIESHTKSFILRKKMLQDKSTDILREFPRFTDVTQLVNFLSEKNILKI